jgi:hypothetical protein
MKKYFNGADIFVFVILVVSIIWISLYKSYWIYDKPIFSDAGTVAGITDTVASSIIASAIFYTITIFIPRYKQIKEMKKNISDDLSWADFYSKMIIDQINNSIKDRKYEYFFNSSFDCDIPKTLKDDFINCYRRPKWREIYVGIMECQVGIMDCIMTSYYSLLPKEVVFSIQRFKKINSKYLNSLSEFFSEDQIFQMDFSRFSKMLEICSDLKKYIK